MNKLKPSRYPSRSSEDPNKIKDVLDEAIFCTIAYVKDRSPFQIPTGFVRKGNYVILHGSTRSHFLQEILDAGQASFSVMIFDAIVLADTAFDHSVNYRSVIFTSTVEEVTDENLKREYLEAFTDKMIPGRMSDLPGITSDELKATRVVRLAYENAILKMRSGDNGKSEGKIWTGVVPSGIRYDIPVANGSLESEFPVPAYLTDMVVKSNIGT